MSDNYDAIPAALRAHVQDAVARARELAAGGHELITIALVGTVGPEPALAIVGTRFTGDTDDEVNDGKDHYAEQVRKVVIDTDADYVVFLSESWTIDYPAKVEAMGGQAMKVFHELVLRHFGSIGNSPYKKDVIMFAVETRDALYYGIGDTTGHDGKPRTIGDIEFIKPDHSGGRFASFFPPQMKGKKS